VSTEARIGATVVDPHSELHSELTSDPHSDPHHGEPMSVTTLGRFTVTPVLDSVVRRPAGLLYSRTPAERWAQHPDMLADEGQVEYFFGGYLVRGGDRTILVDAGVGPDGWRAPSGAVIPGGFLPDAMRVAGIDVAEVTDVVLTHLHADHVGWVATGGKATFPGATIRCHRADWAHFVEGDTPDDVARTLLAPLADRVECWDGDGPLAPDVDLLHTPGHTPGSCSVVVSGDDGSRVMLLGDVVHCPVELLDDEWESIADMDPDLALATRSRLNAELEGAPALIGAAHFPALRFGRLLASPTGRRWQPVG